MVMSISQNSLVRKKFWAGLVRISIEKWPHSTGSHSGSGRRVKITSYSCYSAPKTVVPTISAMRNHVGKNSTSVYQYYIK